MNPTTQEIALGIHKGEIFTDRHISNPLELSMVFMPLVFLSDKQAEEFANRDVGMVYEYLSAAGPRSVNGYPCFFSMRTVTVEQTKEVMGYIKKYKEAEQTVR